MDYLQVAEEEGEEPMELPAEEDGTLLLSTLQAQYPGTSGLKYRNPDTNAIRGIRLVEGRLHPPTVEDGWGAQVYICVFPKGKCVESTDNITNFLGDSIFVFFCLLGKTHAHKFAHTVRTFTAPA